MKKITLILAIALITLSAFKTMADYSQAKVNQIQGINVFIASQPTQQYEYLGTITNNWNYGDKLANKIIAEAKAKYPAANGIIFSNLNLNQADVVKFKNE